MLSYLRQRGIRKITQSLTFPAFTVPLYYEPKYRMTMPRNVEFPATSILSPSSSSSSSRDKQQPDADDISRKRPMKRPIITGRNSANSGEQITEEYPNPFIGKDLPYGRKVIFENLVEEDLANGQHWHVYNDRFMQVFDHDLVDRGWGNLDLYKSPMAKRGMDDITMNHDILYHHHINNIKMTVDMVRHIPHLKPLWPELRQDLDGVCAKWQDVVEEILGNKDNKTEEIEKSSETSTVETTEEIESDNTYKKKVTKKTVSKTKSKKKVYNRLTTNTTIIEDKPLCGQDVIDARKEKLKESLNPNRDRKADIRREIELNTLKQFVDDKVESKDYVRIIFIDALGTKYYVYGVIGETLLQCARRYLVPVDGYCDGSDRGIMRIYGKGPWCHCCQMDISPKYFHLIPPWDYKEASQFINFRHITPTSRLSCCIWIRPEFDGMVINIPVSLPNPYGRFND